MAPSQPASMKNRPTLNPDKFMPLRKKRYMVTDQCFWMTHPPKDYNPLDPSRAPHAVQLVDVETGTVVNLHSGSIIQVIDPNESAHPVVPLPEDRQGGHRRPEAPPQIAEMVISTSFQSPASPVISEKTSSLTPAQQAGDFSRDVG
jgi:hypothetical protein